MERLRHVARGDTRSPERSGPDVEVAVDLGVRPAAPRHARPRDVARARLRGPGDAHPRLQPADRRPRRRRTGHRPAERRRARDGRRPAAADDRDDRAALPAEPDGRDDRRERARLHHGQAPRSPDELLLRATDGRHLAPADRIPASAGVPGAAGRRGAHRGDAADRRGRPDVRVQPGAHPRVPRGRPGVRRVDAVVEPPVASDVRLARGVVGEIPRPSDRRDQGDRDGQVDRRRGAAAVAVAGPVPRSVAPAVPHRLHGHGLRGRGQPRHVRVARTLPLGRRPPGAGRTPHGRRTRVVQRARPARERPPATARVDVGRVPARFRPPEPSERRLRPGARAGRRPLRPEAGADARRRDPLQGRVVLVPEPPADADPRRHHAATSRRGRPSRSSGAAGRGRRRW